MVLAARLEKLEGGGTAMMVMLVKGAYVPAHVAHVVYAGPIFQEGQHPVVVPLFGRAK
jgi:hypothetical protein